MKQLTTKVIAFFMLINSSFAIETHVNTTIESVTIYHSGALVTRTSNDKLTQGVNVLIFKNLSSKIILNSIKVANKEITILNKSIVRKLTNEEYNQLLDQKGALANQMKLIEAKYNDVSFVTKVEDLEKMTTFYYNQILQIKKDIRDVEQKILEAQNLENIEINNENAGILKLIVSIDGPLKEAFKIQYVCGGIGWSPAYEVTVNNPASENLEIKYLARTMSQTGEDWENIVINLSSSFPLDMPTSLPKPNQPWLITKYTTSVENHATLQFDEKENEALQQIDKLEGVEYEDINIPSFLKLRTLSSKYSIKSNSTVFTFPIQTIKLPANFHYYGYPGIDPEVYLVAEVTGWDTLSFVDGIANISYNGNEIGKSVLKFSETKDTLVIPIGKDNNVYMKRFEIPDKNYFKMATIGKKQRITIAYQFELKNNNPFTIHFELVDQVPISQTKSAEVELTQTSGGVINNETSEISWNLELNKGQIMQKQLIFTVEMEELYQYQHSKNQNSYQRSSLPKF